jgi:hypothetical protein
VGGLDEYNRILLKQILNEYVSVRVTLILLRLGVSGGISGKWY